MGAFIVTMTAGKGLCRFGRLAPLNEQGSHKLRAGKHTRKQTTGKYTRPE